MYTILFQQYSPISSLELTDKYARLSGSKGIECEHTYKKNSQDADYPRQPMEELDFWIHFAEDIALLIWLFGNVPFILMGSGLHPKVTVSLFTIFIYKSLSLYEIYT